MTDSITATNFLTTTLLPLANQPKTSSLPDNFPWQNFLIKYCLAYAKDENLMRQMVQEVFPETDVEYVPLEKNGQQVKIKLRFKGQVVAKVTTILPKIKKGKK